MVFLPPDQSTQPPARHINDNINAPIYPTEGKSQVTATAYGPVDYPTPAADGVTNAGINGAQYPEQDVSYHCMSQSMILVQVNPGETFTIQAEDGTQCIEGPAQVPMVSPNGAIPPIHVPHGYISQVIEENGLRRVVVIPEMPHFPGTPAGQPILPQPGMQHLSMQSGPSLNYLQPAMMSLTPQAPFFHTSGEHLPMLHQQPMTFVQAETNLSADTPPIHNINQFHPHHSFPSEMDPSNTRANKIKERMQRKYQERQQHQHPPDSGENPSSSSASPSSPSSFGATPSPNSSPDSSPRIISGSMQTHSNGYNNTRKGVPAGYMPPHHHHHLITPPHFHHQVSPNMMTPPGMNGVNNRNSKNQAMSPRANSDEMSSGSSSSSGGSPRRLPSGVQRVPAPQDMCHQYQPAPQQRENTFQSSSTPQEPFPIFDGKSLSLREYLSAIVKPEVTKKEPRAVRIQWSMKYSLPKEAESSFRDQKIIYEIFLSQRGRDSNQYRSIHRDTNTFFVIKDLKPGMEYFTRVMAELNSTKGVHSEVTSFRTQSCPPDTPGAPKLAHSTKNTLTLKWAAPQDNGEKILKYHLEWDEGKKGSGFRFLYSNVQKQYKVLKLQPSHNYTFRLNSMNKMGPSPWSPEVTYSTNGTAPSAPESPRLVKATVHTLIINWSRVPTGSGDSAYVKFILEMDDVSSGYGFKPVYDGPDMRATIKNLTRCSQYKFRLFSYNNEGKSNHSNTVSFSTLPDKPGVPGKVTLKGKAHPTWFRVSWDPPKDNGGQEVSKYVVECCHERAQPMNIIYSGPEREFSLDNTIPGQSYRLRVHCVSSGGSSLPSEVAVITPPPIIPGQCAPPRQGTKVKPTLISLHWDPPNYTGGAPILSYELAMESPQSSTEIDPANPEVLGQPSSLKQVYHGPALDHAVGGLRPGTSYKFMVRAANKVGCGQWSDKVELGTGAGPPEKPDVPESELVTASSILLSWKEPHDNGSQITGYDVEWGSVNGRMSMQHLNCCMSHNFQHLSPNTAYYFRVQAINAIGKSPFSDVVSVTTSPSCPDQIPKVWQGEMLGPEEYEQEFNESGDEIENYPSPSVCAMVYWDTPASNGSEITFYILEVTHYVKSSSRKRASSSGHHPAEDPILFEVEETPHLITDLQPDTQYRIRVKAVNEMGQGDFSHPIIIETQPLPPDPPTLECSCTFNGLKLKWGDSDSTGSIYLLQMREKHGRFQTIYNGSGRSYRVNRLSERTTYHMRINARNHAGEGPFSPTYTFTTATAPPSQLRNLPVASIKNGCIELSWDEVENSKGDPVSYIVNVEECDDPTNKVSFSLDQTSYCFMDLTPGAKYRAQVAAVRHVYPADASEKMRKSENTDQSTDEDSASDTKEELSPVEPTPEKYVGQFSSWVTFEVPLFQPDSEGDARTVGNHEAPATILKVAPAAMSDERKATLLLAAFFVFAVLLAFLVQCLVS